MNDRFYLLAVVLLLGLFLVMVAEALVIRASFENTHQPASFLLGPLREAP